MCSEKNVFGASMAPRKSMCSWALVRFILSRKKMCSRPIFLPSLGKWCVRGVSAAFCWNCSNDFFTNRCVRIFPVRFAGSVRFEEILCCQPALCFQNFLLLLPKSEAALGSRLSFSRTSDRIIWRRLNLDSNFVESAKNWPPFLHWSCALCKMVDIRRETCCVWRVVWLFELELFCCVYLWIEVILFDFWLFRLSNYILKTTTGLLACWCKRFW